jgi:hypothetical protein
VVHRQTCPFDRKIRTNLNFRKSDLRILMGFD